MMDAEVMASALLSSWDAREEVVGAGAPDGSPPSARPSPGLSARGVQDRTRLRPRRMLSDAPWNLVASPGDVQGQFYAEQIGKAFEALGVPTGSTLSAELHLCIDSSPTRPRSILGPWDATRSPLRLEAVIAMRDRLSGIAAANTASTKILLDADIGLPVAFIGVGFDHVNPRLTFGGGRGPSRTFRFLHISDGPPDADLGLLIEAFRYVFDGDDDVCLTVCVPPEHRSETARQLSMGLPGNGPGPSIVVRDGPDGTDTERLYADADVFVTASGRPNTALPLRLAVAHGLPIIAVPWGGHRDVVDDRNGWTVDFDYLQSGDPERIYAVQPRFSSLIDRLATAFAADRQTLEALGSSGLAQMETGHRWTDVARRLLSFGERIRATASTERPVVAWLTSWNTRCGIANASASMVAAGPQRDVLVFAPFASDDELTRADQSHCLRLWQSGKAANGLDRVLKEIRSRSVRALIVQYNYGFYNHRELVQLLEKCIDQDVRVIVEFHSTIDPYGEAVDNWCIRELTPALRRCDRILLHEVADMERLKAIGVVDNVTLFPLGAIKYSRADDPATRSSARNSAAGRIPMVACYGFCLPNKGFPELIETAAILSDMGRPIRLRMVTALHADPSSHAELLRSREIVRTKEMGDSVEFITDYLSDDDSLRLLSEADLVVNPYQRTTESASASVRHGLSTGRPVAVTPLPIFEDLGQAVFRMAGPTPREMAGSIADILEQVERSTEEAAIVAAAAQRWVDQHDYNVVGGRLWNLAAALVRHPSP